MVKEIVFTCDPCAADGRHSPATHVGLMLAIGRRKPKMLDLCDSHNEQLIAPVIEALSSWGYTDDVPTPARRASPAAESPYDSEVGPYQCGLCEQRPKHLKSFSNHVRQVHETTLTAYRAEHGDPQLVAVA